jgi:hypothetical protein
MTRVTCYLRNYCGKITGLSRPYMGCWDFSHTFSCVVIPVALQVIVLTLATAWHVIAGKSLHLRPPIHPCITIAIIAIFINYFMACHSLME